MNKTEQRPWGSFTVLLDEGLYWVKQLIVQPGCQLSLQRHKNRKEFWVIIEGEGLVVKEGFKDRKVSEGDIVTIPKECLHRLKNTGRDNLIVIESAIGNCQEEDIERIKDDYNRC